MNSKSMVSEENYLRTIQKLNEKNGYARNVDVAKELHYAESSVSVAMKKLCAEGYVEKEYANLLFLTQSGSTQIQYLNGENQNGH